MCIRAVVDSSLSDSPPIYEGLNLIQEITDEIIGKRFGNLTVIKFNNFYVKPSDGKKEKRWLCLCDCGGLTITSKRKLQTGWTQSCGCLLKTRGGITKDDEVRSTYNVWNLINQRCYNENNERFENYGGRGVVVCPRWMMDNPEGFSNFLKDLGLKPTEEHTIERNNVDGDYSPENCRWVDDPSLQAYNQTIKNNNTSGKTGVGFDKSKPNSPWYAAIRKGNRILKKTFSDFKSAAEQWEIELYGFNKR